MKSAFTKIITISLVAAFIAAPFAVPFFAQAQLVPDNHVPVRLNGEPASSLGAGDIPDISSCDTSESINAAVSAALPIGSKLLGENETQILYLQSQIDVVKKAIACWEDALREANGATKFAASSLFNFSQINAVKDQGLSQIVNLKNIQKQLEGRLQVASQGFWKAVLVGLLLKQTDQLAEKLVNDLTEKFKINNYAQYVGAVADTVYVNSMILRHVDNDKDRAIVRSMITNPLLKKGIHPAIQAAGDAYVGGSITQGRFDDPQWASKIGRDAQGEEYKTQYQSAMISKTDEVIAKAREAAALEVQQSGGYKSTLNNCGPTMSEQKQKDAQYAAILAEINDRQSLSQTISSANNSTAVEKAQVGADIKNANSKLASFTDSFGAAVVHICEGVNTPALKFKDTIHDLIGSQIEKFTSYNEHALTGLQSLVVNIADSLVNKLVFGKDYSKGDLINDATGSLTAGIAGTLSKPSASTSTGGTLGGTTSNPVGNVSIYATTTQGSRVTSFAANQNYIITFDFADIVDERPFRYVITGLPLDGTLGSQSLTPTDLAAKKLQFDYKADAKPVNLSITFYAPPAPNTTGDIPLGPYRQSFSAGGVAGASIVLPRGPALSFR